MTKSKKKRVRKAYKSLRRGLPIPKRLARKLAEDSALDRDNPLRITNETVAEHREEVLSSARKYIYPLQHSKHKIVVISSALFVSALVIFFSYCMLGLYRFKSSSDFLYGVTQVIPFPVARADGRFISYENYLFELRHYVHYYETQQKQDFTTAQGKKQLTDYKKQALDKVINDSYVKQLAAVAKISVSDRELNDQITLVREQNRLGANEKGFEDVIRDNFGWSVNDFKRELKQQLLAEKVVASLDTAAQSQADAALAELRSGTDFATVAAKYSQDPSTKANGGDYGFAVDKANRDVPAQITSALYSLTAGQYSGIINTGYTLEIVKNIEPQGDKIHAAHIVITLKDINTYVSALRAQHKPTDYIKL
jgi:hypothetical protein